MGPEPTRAELPEIARHEMMAAVKCRSGDLKVGVVKTVASSLERCAHVADSCSGPEALTVRG
jgi:hypothetical protein